jgi:hypothetical protein
MKVLIAILVLSFNVCATPAGKAKNLPVTKDDRVVKQQKVVSEKLKALDKKLEDCDEKAKKPVEIKTESLSLSGGTAGCTLDEAH